MNTFYVYIYLDPRKPGEYIYENMTFNYEPFYIGKGKNNRLYDHWTNKYYKGEFEKNRHKNRKLKKIEDYGLLPIIFLLYNNLPQEVANNIEKLVIKRIGRYDLGKGPLCNLTDGGDGTINSSAESRKKISDALKGKPSCRLGSKHTEATKRKIATKSSKQMKGIPRTEYEKQCISRTHKGKVVSEETRKRISESHKGQKAWNKGLIGVQKAWNKGKSGLYGTKEYTFLKDGNLITITNLKGYCKENSLVYSTMMNIHNNGYQTKEHNKNYYKGYSG